jgi:hypothetical protein
MLGLDCPVVDEIAGIGLIRRCEPTYADAEEAEFRAVRLCHMTQLPAI